MKRSLFVLTCLLAVGCTENRRTWFIRQNQVFSGSPPECLVPDDVDAPFRTVGTLDTALRSDYVLTPLIENQLMGRKDYSHLRDEPNGIQVEGAEVRVWCNTADGEPAFEPFFSPASSYLDPEDTGASAFVALDGRTTGALAGGACCADGAACPEQLVIIGVRMVGITNGGIETETPEFMYPIFVCDGCLLACTAEANDEEVLGPDCCATDAPSETPCAIGQDDAVDCRLAPSLIPNCGNDCSGLP